MTIDFPEATNDRLTPIRAPRCRWALAIGFQIFESGIITNDLMPPPILQRALFYDIDHERAAKVTAVMDEANR